MHAFVLLLISFIVSVSGDTVTCDSYISADVYLLSEVAGVRPTCSTGDTLVSNDPGTASFDFFIEIDVTNPATLYMGGIDLLGRSITGVLYFLQSKDAAADYIGNLDVSISVVTYDSETCSQTVDQTQSCPISTPTFNSMTDICNSVCGAGVSQCDRSAYTCGALPIPYVPTTLRYFLKGTVVSNLPFNGTDPWQYFSLNIFTVTSTVFPIPFVNPLGLGGCDTFMPVDTFDNEFSPVCDACIDPMPIAPFGRTDMDRVPASPSCVDWNVAVTAPIDAPVFQFSVPIQLMNLTASMFISSIQFDILVPANGAPTYFIENGMGMSQTCDIINASVTLGQLNLGAESSCGYVLATRYSYNGAYTFSIFDDSVMVLSLVFYGFTPSAILISPITITTTDPYLIDRAYVFNNVSCSTNTSIDPLECVCVECEEERLLPPPFKYSQSQSQSQPHSLSLSDSHSESESASPTPTSPVRRRKADAPTQSRTSSKWRREQRRIIPEPVFEPKTRLSRPAHHHHTLLLRRSIHYRYWRSGRLRISRYLGVTVPFPLSVRHTFGRG